ncbi:MAG: glutamate synthase small subunit [Candidatus Omnitrophica bacterium]|nr:glutamate synthase small subunit [Candidatus Omnitrophota bacterium]
MAKDVKAFLKTRRKTIPYRPVCERIKDYKEVVTPPAPEHTEEQVARCMDCGTPFCHWACPIGNYIPEWNDLVMNGQWEEAFRLLDATNNLPEITGRVCPALCEFSCVLGITDDPVTIRENELAIIEEGFQKGYLKPRPPQRRTGKTVAVIGSGPAGFAAAAQLNRAGHRVTVFEKDPAPGGIMRYGIPDFKLEKGVLDRRIDILRREGIEFRTGTEIGKDISSPQLRRQYDAVVVTIGSRVPRDLSIEGRRLRGIHFAMDYLIQNNRRLCGLPAGPDELIEAKEKQVVVVGGGDTGSDCVGTANRQGAACVVQIELMPRPPECRSDADPWPRYPLLLKTSSSHEEGAQRMWSILTKRFLGENGAVKALQCVQVEFAHDEQKGCPVMREVPDSEFEIPADLVILAVGFLSPEARGPISELGLEVDRRGNIQTDDRHRTSVEGVFAAGDARRGQSLIVWAIAEGRAAARHVDEYLMGSSDLPAI